MKSLSSDADLSPNERSERIDILALANKLWRHRILGLVLIVVFLAAAMLYLNNASYVYTAKLVVTPADQASAKPSSALMGLSSIAGITIGNQQGSAFSMYSEAVRSTSVADKLSSDDRIMHKLFSGFWDQQTSTWREPKSFGRSIVLMIKGIIGIPTRAWRPPNGQDLQEFIERYVVISEDIRKSFITLTYRHPDPQFAVYFLDSLNNATDAFLREKALARSLTYIRYLEKRLKEVQVAEYRQSLAETLSNYEKTAMMASSDASFSIEKFGETWISPYPTSPNPRTTLLFSGVLAIAAWAIYVLVLKSLFALLRSKEVHVDETVSRHG